MRRIVTLLSAFAALTGCGWVSGDEASAPDAVQAGPETKRFADPVVISERRAFGRWRSEPGILPGVSSLYVIIDVAGTKDMQIELRGRSSRRDAVYAIAKGKVEITSEGVSATAPDAGRSLAPFSEFTATFPNTSMMSVLSSDGRRFEFRYDGV